MDFTDKYGGFRTQGGFDLETTYRLYICFVKFHGGVGILGMISIEISQLWFQQYVIIIN